MKPQRPMHIRKTPLTQMRSLAWPAWAMLASFAMPSLSFAQDAAQPTGISASSYGTKPSVDEMMFRDIFLGSLSAPRTEEQKKQLIFLPTPEVMEAPAGAVADSKNAGDFFKKLDAVVSKSGQTGLDLYRRGQALPAQAWTADEIEKTLGKHGENMEDRITFVVVPGIFAGLLDTLPFQELLDQPSVFRDTWRRTMQDYRERIRQLPPGEEKAQMAADLKDSVYNMGANGQVEIDLENVFRMGSVEVGGKSVVNLIVLPAERLAMESVGELRDVSVLINRRLQKLFRIMGTPKNLAFIGYSRGTPVALDLLSLARETQSPWLENVRAMVSLGGVTYGADLADQSVNSVDAPVEYRVLSILDELIDPVKGLQQIPPAANLRDVISIHAHNDLLYIRLMNRYRGLAKEYAAHNPPKPPKKKKAKIEERGIWAGVRLRIEELGKQKQELDKARTKILHLDHFYSEYNQNIQRFSYGVRAAVVAIKDLSSSHRFEWWSKNVIPSARIRYYSLSGVMLDGREETARAAKDARERDEVALARNDQGYKWTSPDDFNLAFNWKQFRGLKAQKDGTSGIGLNDSQVSTQRTRFWPEIAQLLNPNQPAYQASFLGVVGTHHWGLALRNVTSQNPSDANPFPRVDLLKALGVVVAYDF